MNNLINTFHIGESAESLKHNANLKDIVEDENTMYINTCIECGGMFKGHINNSICNRCYKLMGVERK